jgi:hypothetical protein
VGIGGGSFSSKPFDRRAPLTCLASERSQILTMGPLGAATVVVGCEGVTLVLVESGSAPPHPHRATTTTEAITTGIDLTTFTYPS